MLVDVRDMSIRLGGKIILAHVDLHVDPGEIVTIVGPNGSGKSSLLRAILGVVRPSHGNIQIKPGLRVGYVPQKLHIDQTLPMSVLRFLNLPTRVRLDAARSALEQASVVDIQNAQMTNLSGGQFQRVLLARALLNAPELLVLDEPTQGLDQAGSAAFYRRIEEVRQSLGCAILMVSHELHVVMAASDRVVCLNGHVCCHGTPEHVASAPEYRALFGSGTQGALALYRHDHNHSHDHSHDHEGQT